MAQEEALAVTREVAGQAGERAGADPWIDGCPEEVAAAIKSALGAGAISPERAQLLLDTVKSRVEVDIAALTVDRVAKIQGILAAPRLNLMVTYQSSAIPRASASSRMPPKMPPDGSAALLREVDQRAVARGGHGGPLRRPSVRPENHGVRASARAGVVFDQRAVCVWIAEVPPE